MMSLFISYDREDKAAVEPLVVSLKASGVAVWWDADTMGGSNFDEEIERRIRSADAVIVVWSKRSIRSQWVKAEAATALKLSKLIPVSIEPLSTLYVPLPFNNVHTIDLTSKDNSTPSDSITPIMSAVEEKRRTNDFQRSHADAIAGDSLISLEKTYFEAISKSRNIEDWKGYLRKFPRGTFVEIAETRLKRLESSTPLGRVKAVGAWVLIVTLLSGLTWGGYSGLEFWKQREAAAALAARKAVVVTTAQELHERQSYNDRHAREFLDSIEVISSSEVAADEELEKWVVRGAMAFLEAGRTDFMKEVAAKFPDLVTSHAELSVGSTIAHGTQILEVERETDDIWSVRDSEEFEELVASYELYASSKFVAEKFPELIAIFEPVVRKLRGQSDSQVASSMERASELRSRDIDGFNNLAGRLLTGAYRSDHPSTESAIASARLTDLIINHAPNESTDRWRILGRDVGVIGNDTTSTER